MTAVAILGQGQVGHAVAEILRARGQHQVLGPFGRSEADLATRSKADVVLIATTTRLADVAQHVEEAVTCGSNVLVTAEEAADPYLADAEIAIRLDLLAREHDVSICGTGVNPGLIFDALVLTLLGAHEANVDIVVRRTVDISGFGGTVLRLIGIGLSPDEFGAGVSSGSVLGHAGFPQSMSLVAKAIGIVIDQIDRDLSPVFAITQTVLPNGIVIAPGQTVGVDQTYVAIVQGRAWFTSGFYGHVDLTSTGRKPSDVIEFWEDGGLVRTFSATPGIGAQSGSQNVITNSIDRIIRAQPGWISVADLPPAFPSRVYGHRMKGISG